jgi:signal transduction histidine kinase
MSRLTIFQSMMGLTVVCGLLMALWLARNASGQKGIKALAGFNFFMALWCAGHWLLSLDFPTLGETLLSLNPLMPTLFLHFSLRFVTDKIPNATRLNQISRYIPLSYVLSISVVIISIGWSGNTVEPWLDFPWFLILGNVGWVNLLYTVLIGFLGHGILVWGYANSQGNTRRTIMLLFGAGAWGFTLATSYILPSLGLNYYPYLMWLMPSYLILLSFAVLRYQFLAVNYWAIKAIIWAFAVLVLLLLTTLLTSMASQLGVPHLSTIPLSIIWLYSITSGLALWLLYNPLHLLASRLVYPDVKLTDKIIDHWLLSLNATQSYSELSDTATKLISEHIHQQVIIAINHHPSTSHLLIECYQQNDGWKFDLKNWLDVTPGIRHVAEIFAPLLYTSCLDLDKSLRLAQQEQRRQEELRLVELGAMAASIAHELRNPLNIISMASAQCEDHVKEHIQQQLKRSDTLIQDLLSYARVIELNCQPVLLLPIITALSKGIAKQHDVAIDIDCDAQLSIYADVNKLQQVLVNCLDNGAAFASTVPNGKVLVQCQQNAQSVEIAFHNNGPQISEAFQPQLFKPFISKRVGGSGLGLAIVHRIMKAHNGSVTFDNQLGWNVSFVCCFPTEPTEQSAK